MTTWEIKSGGYPPLRGDAIPLNAQRGIGLPAALVIPLSLKGTTAVRIPPTGVDGNTKFIV